MIWPLLVLTKESSIMFVKVTKLLITLFFVHYIPIIDRCLILLL